MPTKQSTQYLVHGKYLLPYFLTSVLSGCDLLMFCVGLTLRGPWPCPVPDFS